MTAPSRTLTTVAVGFLSLDALLLGYGGYESGRPLLTAAGGVCALGVVLVVIGWRRYRRDIARQRGVGSSRVDLQACKLEYSIVSPK